MAGEGVFDYFKILFPGQVLRHLDHDLDEEVAVVVRAQLFDAAVLHPEHRARLRPFRDAELLCSFQSGDGQSATERRLRNGQRHFQLQVAAHSAEELMRFDGDLHHQRAALAAVPATVALACVSDGLPVVYACRYVDRDLAHAFRPALTSAGLAGFGDHFPGALTRRAYARAAELSERSALHLRDTPGAVAVGAGLERFAVLCARAVARRAIFHAFDGYLLLHAERRLFECEGHAHAYIRAALGRVRARLLRASAAEAAEYGGENVVHIEAETLPRMRAAEAAESAEAAETAPTASHGSVFGAVFVVSGALLRIG